MNHFEEATISSIHRAYQQGAFTCRELVTWHLGRIEKYDATLRSIITLNTQALAQADACDIEIHTNGVQKPLMGIPVLVKDNIETSEMPTTAGSIALAGFQPTEDAPLIRALRNAGAIILGKTNLHEFAIWGETISSIKGQTLNPYDLTRTPGGSSGGTGAAIASNFAVLGIGTDTVNSVRSPASANALVGIRPTHGLITSDGIVPYALCQDTAGPICRTVADAAVTLAIIANGSTSHHLAMYRAAMAEASLGGKRIGIIKPFFGSDSVHTDVNTCMQQSLSVFSQEGAALIDINSLPLSKAHAPAFDGAAEIPLDSHWLIENVSMHLYALQDDLDAYLQAHADAMNVHSISDILAAHLYHPNIGAHLEEAMRYDKASSAYAHRQLRSALVREALLALFQRLNLDALVYPHQQRLVCKTGAHQLNRNGVLSAITGFPAITVPAGFSAPSAEAPIGIPIGIELLGKPWDETALIALAYAFEQQTHFRKAPQLFT